MKIDIPLLTSLLSSDSTEMSGQAAECQGQIDAICAIAEDDSLCNSQAYRKMYDYFQQVKIPALVQHLVFIDAFIADMATDRQRLSELSGYGYPVIDTDQIQHNILSLQQANSDLRNWIDTYADDNPESALNIQDSIDENNAKVQKLQELLEKAHAYLSDGSIYSTSRSQLDRVNKANSALNEVLYDPHTGDVDLSKVDGSWIGRQLAADYLAARNRLALDGEPNEELMKALLRAQLGLHSTTCAYGGDPVNLATGNFASEIEFLKLKGAYPLSLKLSYNSCSDVSGCLGRGWTLGHEIAIALRTDGAVIHWGDGHDELLYTSGDGSFMGAGALPAVLTKSADGFELSRRNKANLSFDPSGRIIRARDENGNGLDFSYDDAGHHRLQKVASTTGEHIAYRYSDEGSLVSASDSAGRAVSFGYEEGQLARVANELGDVVFYEYRNGLLTAITNPAGIEELANEYDDDARIVRQTFANGSTIEYVYDDDRNILRVTERNGSVSSYERNNLLQTIAATDTRGTARTTYDTHGRRTSLTDHGGYTTMYHYDDDGNLTRVDTPDRNWRTMEYDQAGRVTRIELSGREIRRNRYDESGNLVQVWDGLGRTQSFARNASGRPTTIVAADGSETNVVYDAHGNIVRIIDPLGNITSYEYDGLGNVVVATDGKGNRTRFAYDARGNIVGVTDAEGQSRQYAYDKLGNVVSIEDFDGTRVVREYDAMGCLIRFVDQRGNATRYEYDAMGRMTARISPRGARTEFTLDEHGNPVRMTDALGNAVERTYDSRGNCRKVMYPDGSEEKVDYDGMSRPVRVVATDGRVSTFSYDRFGLIRQITNTAGGKRLFFRDDAGQLVREIDEGGNETRYEYDSLGNLARTTDTAGRVTSRSYYPGGLLERIVHPDGTWEKYFYDACGNVIEVRHQNGLAVTYRYDRLNRVVAVATNEGHCRKQAYDAMGNVIESIDANGAATRYSYSPTGKLAEVVDALGNRTSYGYDACDDISRIDRYAEGAGFLEGGGLSNRPEHVGSRWTIYERDLIGRLVGVRDSAGNSESYSYTAMGQLASKTDGDGLLTEFFYAKGGLLEHVDYADGQSVTLGYDALRLLSLVKDRLGEMQIVHDRLGNVTEVTDELGNTVSYDRGPLGACTAITYPDGKKAAYEYDELLRCSKITADAMEVSYTYDANGCLNSKSFSNGCVSTYSYTSLGSLSRLTNSDTKGVVDDFCYEYDNALNRVGVKSYRRGLPGESGEYAYSYDLLGRMTGVSRDGAPIRSYEYDAFGNRIGLWEREARTAYEYNSADQLIRRTTPDDSFEYAYDGRGNLTCISQGTRILNRYGYDARNRLSWSANERSARTYEYNGLGQRVREHTFDAATAQMLASIPETHVGPASIAAAPMQSVEYVLDTTKRYRNLLQSRREGETESYVWGNDLVFQTDGMGAYAVITDGLGSVLHQANCQTGEMTGYAYDEFGCLGRVVNQTMGSAQSFGFTGYLWDETARTYHAQAREYIPSLGRFAGRDICKGMSLLPQSLNEYAYCWNAPLTLFDPDGMVSMEEGNEAHRLLQEYLVLRHPGNVEAEYPIPGASYHGDGPCGYADLVYFNGSVAEIYEIKPGSYAPTAPYHMSGQAQLDGYVSHWTPDLERASDGKSGFTAVRGTTLFGVAHRLTLPSEMDPNLSYTYYAYNYDPGMIYYNTARRKDPEPEPELETESVVVPERAPAWERGPGLAPLLAGAGLILVALVLFADDVTGVGAADDPIAAAAMTEGFALVFGTACP